MDEMEVSNLPISVPWLWPGGGGLKWSWLRKAQATSVLLRPIKNTRHFIQAKYTKLCYWV